MWDCSTVLRGGALYCTKGKGELEALVISRLRGRIGPQVLWIPVSSPRVWGSMAGAGGEVDDVRVEPTRVGINACLALRGLSYEVEPAPMGSTSALLFLAARVLPYARQWA